MSNNRARNDLRICTYPWRERVVINFISLIAVRYHDSMLLQKAVEARTRDAQQATSAALVVLAIEKRLLNVHALHGSEAPVVRFRRILFVGFL
jgi:hypothetical protein